MIKTVKNQTNLRGKESESKLDFQTEYVKEVFGVEPKDISKIKDMESNSRLMNDYLLQPVYLFKYKNKIFGYYPMELGTLDDMIAFCKSQEDGKDNALAALMFREVKPSSVSKDVKWKSAAGMQVAFIDDFPKNFASYKTKKLTNFHKIDFNFFDDLPYQIIASAVNFTMGLGLAFKMNTQKYSKKDLQMRQHLVAAFNHNLLSGMELQYRLRCYEKMNQTSCGSVEPSPYYKSLQSLLSTGWFKGNTRQKRIRSEIWVLTGDTTWFDHEYVQMIDEIYSLKAITKDTAHDFSEVCGMIQKMQ